MAIAFFLSSKQTLYVLSVGSSLTCSDQVTHAASSPFGSSVVALSLFFQEWSIEPIAERVPLHRFPHSMSYFVLICKLCHQCAPNRV